MKRILAALIVSTALLALGGCCWWGPGGPGGPGGGGHGGGGEGGPGMFQHGQ